MNDTLTDLTAWFTAHRIETWTVGSIAALAIVGVIIFEITRRLSKASTNLKSLVGYGVVQVGMAYVTITGGYDFWRHVAQMPLFEAWAVAVIVESAQWWFIGRIFRYMNGTHTEKADDGTETEVRNEGYGPAGPKFWSAVVGGGILAVIGALFIPTGGGVPLAIGRAVVVYIGVSMFDLLLREKVYEPGAKATKTRPTFLLTPRRLGVKLGILSAEAKDLRQDNREWTIQRMTRAIRWLNDDNRMFEWFGKRALRRAMEGGDSTLFADAVSRYAMTYVLITDIKPDSALMSGAIGRARSAVTRAGTEAPAVTPEDPAPSDTVVQRRTVADTVGQPPLPPVTPPMELWMLADKTTPPPAPRRERPRPAVSAVEAAALREQAVAWAVDQLRQGQKVTAKSVGLQFKSGEEWGRQRLNEARGRVGEVVSSVNGNVPAL